MLIDRDFVAEAQEYVIPNIGQIPHRERLALERAVRAGTVAKWRGFWFPVAGSQMGVGPLKTCYGPPRLRELFAPRQSP